MCISDLQVFNTRTPHSAISNHRCYFSVKLQSTSFTDTLTMLTDNWDFFLQTMYVQDLIKISYLRLVGMWLAIQRYTCSYIK